MSEEKYTGPLEGCAVGDALGMCAEGWDPRQIVKYVGRITTMLDPIRVEKDGELVTEDEFGKIKYWTKEFEKGEFTDDTILTLALAETIALHGLDLEEAAKGQLYQYTSRLRADGTVKGGFGGTTLSGFKNLIAGKSPLESGVIGGPGNAPAMKMSPVGVYAALTYGEDLDEALKFAEKVGRITHLDPRSVASGVIQANAVYMCLSGCDRQEFIEALPALGHKVEGPLTPKHAQHRMGSLTARLEWIADNRDVSTEEAHKHLGSNSAVYRSYPFALFMAQKYWDEPERGLIDTVNFGGDCDTTGAMFASIMGSRHRNPWPKAWLADLKEKERIYDIGRALYESVLQADL